MVALISSSERSAPASPEFAAGADVFNRSFSARRFESSLRLIEFARMNPAAAPARAAITMIQAVFALIEMNLNKRRWKQKSRPSEQIASLIYRTQRKAGGRSRVLCSDR